jgi:cytochrome P450
MEVMLILFLLIICTCMLISPKAQARRRKAKYERELQRVRDLGQAARRKETERAAKRSIREMKKIVDAEIYSRRAHITPNSMQLYRRIVSKYYDTYDSDGLLKLYETVADQKAENTEFVLRKILEKTVNT